MSELETIYNEKCNIHNDINEHLPVLKKYSEECQHITEMGVREAFSTYAFMMGKPEKLVCIDIMPIDEAKVAKLCVDNNIDFKFILNNTTKIDIEETDLLFIDTEHNYLQLKTELLMHANKAKKYIIFHDTVTFGHRDSNAYGCYVNLECIDSDDSQKQGLIPAINEFLEKNKNWKMHEHYTNNNGLMILKRD